MFIGVSGTSLRYNKWYVCPKSKSLITISGKDVRKPENPECPDCGKTDHKEWDYKTCPKCGEENKLRSAGNWD